MNVTGDTHIGLVRSSNQDALEFARLDEQTAFAVVCDGMGGANGGNVASDIAVRVLSKRIREAYADGQEVHSPEFLLASAMAAANIEIYDTAQTSPELDGMGTTVVAVILHRLTAYISHVGDSRVYLCRGGTLTPVTRDHSIVQDMIEKGQISEAEARIHPRRNFITRALGVQEDESGEYDELALQPGDRLLLCTDGLTNMVDTAAAAAIVTQQPPEQAVASLIRAALDSGGTDNVTAVILATDRAEKV